MKADQWIDRVKKARGWDSDYRVANELNLTRQAVSGYRRKPMTLDEVTAVKVAEILGLNPAGIIIDQVAERSKDDSVRATLHKMAAELCILC